MIEIKDLNKINEILQNDDRIYKYAGLFTPEGEKIFAFNSDPSKINSHVENIKKRISGELSPEGTYIIKLKSNNSKTAPCDELCYIKGSGTLRENTPIVPITQTKNVLSFEEAVRLHAEIEKLKYEVLKLSDDIKAKDQEIERLIKEMDEEPEQEQEQETLRESGSGVFDGLSKLAPTLVAFGNSWLEHKDKELQLNKMELIMSNKNSAKLPSASGSEQGEIMELDADEDQLKILQSLIELKKANPEAYQTFLNKFYSQGG